MSDPKVVTLPFGRQKSSPDAATAMRRLVVIRQFVCANRAAMACALRAENKLSVDDLIWTSSWSMERTSACR